MPRQPFLPDFSHLQYGVGVTALEDRPELAAIVANCIARWSYVDNEMGNLFSTLLGSDSPATLELFLVIRRANNQINAIRVAAKHALSDEKLRLFEALMRVYESLEKERNALAHGCFGIASNDPSVLLWIDVKDHVHFQAEVLPKIHNGKSVANPHERLKNKMFVYHKADLLQILDNIKQLWETMNNFNCHLLNTSQVHYLNEVLRCSQEFPLIRDALERTVLRNSAL
jgi:hypothetical protein